MKLLLKLIIIITGCLLQNNAFCQFNLVKQWDAGFGGDRSDLLTSFQETRDGGYILAGYSKSLAGGDKTQTLWGGTGDDDYWIVKTDAFGNKEWDKDFGGTFSDKLYAVKQMDDGGYLFAGHSISGISGDKTQPAVGNTDYWIVKTDSLGTKLWDKVFGGTDYDYLSCMIATADGGYMLGGVSSSPAGGDKSQPSWGGWDFWIIKMDAQGNKIWDKDFGGTDHDYLNAIEQTADGGYLLGGYSASDVSGDKTEPRWGLYDNWIVKTDSLGNFQWDKNLGGYSNDFINSVYQTSDHGYILAGISESNMGGDKSQNSWGYYDYWIIKTDSSGNKLWDKNYGGSDDDEFFGNITSFANGDLMLAGISYSNISGNKTENNLGIEQSWIVKIDSSGTILWDKTIFTEGHDEEGYAIKTSDGCLAFANQTTGGIAGYKSDLNQDTMILQYRTCDYWIVKFCDSTFTNSVYELPGQQILIFPDPVSDQLNIKLDNTELTEIILYDISARRILRKEFINTISLNLSSLQAGIFFYELRNKNGGFKKGKIVKE